MNTEKVIKRDQKYIMHTYARSPLVLEHGEGMYAYDADGKAYLDFTSGIGVNALGYCHPAWVQAVTMQATRLQHSSNLYYTAPCGKLAKRLCARTGLDQVFFGNSGAEANEGAIKCARKYSVTTYGPDRNKVLTLVNSFHGRTLATLTATGQDVFHKDFGPFPANFGYIPANDFDTFKAAVDDSVCAVMMEMVQGEGGVVALDADYVQSVADYCHAHDILIIVDEVQTGVGRTGTFLACEQFGLKPDLVTLAKGLGGGLPIGAVLMNEKVAAGMGAGTHGSTFAGGPLACALAATTLDVMINDGVIENSRKMGEYFRKQAHEIIEKNHPETVNEIRGLGLIDGIQLNKPSGQPVVDLCFKDSNVLINNTNGNVLRFVPPLIVNEEEIDIVIKAVDEAMTKLGW